MLTKFHWLCIMGLKGALLFCTKILTDGDYKMTQNAWKFSARWRSCSSKKSFKKRSNCGRWFKNKFSAIPNHTYHSNPHPLPPWWGWCGLAHSCLEITTFCPSSWFSSHATLGSNDPNRGGDGRRGCVFMAGFGWRLSPPLPTSTTTITIAGLCKVSSGEKFGTFYSCNIIWTQLQLSKKFYKAFPVVSLFLYRWLCL